MNQSKLTCIHQSSFIVPHSLPAKAGRGKEMPTGMKRGIYFAIISRCFPPRNNGRRRNGVFPPQGSEKTGCFDYTFKIRPKKGNQRLVASGQRLVAGSCRGNT
jgi:hypothetical protein